MAESKWAEIQDALVWLKSVVKTIESDYSKMSQVGPGSSWALPGLTWSQIGPMNQYGSDL